ncbi:MAG: hypothetical protein ACAI25_04515 [Planctomycetota bacterium]
MTDFFDQPWVAPFLYWGGFGLLLLCMLLLARSIAPWLARRRWITEASRALDGAVLVRGAFGVVTHARGVLDGWALVVTRAGVEVEGEKRAVLIPAATVTALAADRDKLRAALVEALVLHRGTALVRGAVAGTTCPYCKDDVVPRESEGTIRCPSCESIHHTPCWQEHGGCSVHGCSRIPSTDAAARVRRP